MKTLTYTCDVCGKQKGAANHWLMAKCFESAKFGPEFLKWDTGRSDAIHLCGQECCHKLLDKWLQGRQAGA